MTEKELLKENGWEIECESPFEIRHKDGSFASMNAAYSILKELESLVDNQEDDFDRWKGKYIIRKFIQDERINSMEELTLIKLADVRENLGLLDREEITMSRFAEILNECANVSLLKQYAVDIEGELCENGCDWTQEKHKPQLDISVVSCWAVLLQWTTGCEADSESTEVKAVFMTKQQADEYRKILKPQIKWHHYYQGYLEVEEVPFEPCS